MRPGKVRKRTIFCTVVSIAVGFGGERSSADGPSSLPPISATFSIVAADPETGECGAAVASKYPAVGKVVPYVRGGVGAFCTQHWHHPPWGEKALDLLEAGKAPEDIVAELLRSDEKRELRQLAIVDMQGRVAVHNPSQAKGQSLYWAAMCGRFYSCQGNTLAGRDVIVNMSRAYEHTSGTLADRLMAALVAGDRVGGDHRGRLAAGIRVARRGAQGHTFALDVDKSDDAVNELAKKYAAWKKAGAKSEGRFEWPGATPAAQGMDEAKLRKARDYALTGGGSGYVTRHGKLVMSWGDPKRRYDLKSTTKAIGVTAMGLAIIDGKMNLSDKAVKYHPTFAAPPDGNKATGWIDKITLLHLATQTAGFEKPGGYGKLLFAPGTKWHYSDAGPNWLAECITLVYKRDVADLMFERVFTPLGIRKNDLTWRKNAYRAAKIDGVMRREFGSGISANVDAMARIGYLYLRGGEWNGRRIIPRSFVDRVRTAVPAVVGLPEWDDGHHGNASDHYGLLWWNNADGTLAGVPRDAYWSWGLYDSLIVVIPSLDIVVARAGKSWKRTEGARHYDVLKPFLEPIVASVKDPGGDKRTAGR